MQIVVLAVERRVILTVLHLRDTDILAATVVGPRVIAADVDLRIADAKRADDCAAMPAGVEEAADEPGRVAHQDHGLAADGRRDEIVRFRNLALEADEHPCALEDVRDFELVDRGIGEDIAMDAEDAIAGPVVNELVEIRHDRALQEVELLSRAGSCVP